MPTVIKDKHAEVTRWLEYLRAADMVAFNEIRAFDQVHEARRFCKCLRVGWFADVTDLQIWNALQALRIEFPERNF